MQIDKVPFITDHGHVSKGTVVEEFLVSVVHCTMQSIM